jgi:hypothetical protein
MRTLLSILIASLLGSSSLFAGEPDVSATAATSKLVGANVANPERSNGRPDQTLLNQMIGDWDVDYAIYDEHGNVRHYLGSATYRWILDGTAIQEIWTSNYHDRKAQPYGTTIEFYDARREHWTAIWIYPEKGMYYSLSGGATAGSIVLSGSDQEGVMQRWSTGNFRGNSFVGRFEASKDGGKTWRMVGVNRMQRHQTHGVDR